MSRPLFAAAERLCPQVRHLVVDVPGEGEELAAWLREEYGAAVLRPGGAAPDVTLAFGPGGEERGRVLRLYGPAPRGWPACAPYRRREGCRRTWPPFRCCPCCGSAAA